jgi:SAM-dependent methyltransferase
MKYDPASLALFCCPKDGADLREDRPVPGMEPTLVCTTCSRQYPVRRGIPRFVESDQYAGNFSHEWTVHRTTQLDSGSLTVSEATFAEKTGWKAEDVRGKRVLDVGCGMGRFADVILRWGGEVVGVDLSFAVESAAANLGHHPSFRAAQASVFELPFRPESFDLIYSLGVLHHTADCERAFKCLPRLLRPGGEIAVWLYSAHSYPGEGTDERRDRLYRRFTTRMSPRTLHAICRVLCRFPMKRRGLWHMLLPGFMFHAIPKLHHTYPDYDWRVLDTFDWYSPTYQSKHSYPEVCRWFREVGLVDVEPLDFEVCVRGRKPGDRIDSRETARCVELSA